MWSLGGILINIHYSWSVQCTDKLLFVWGFFPCFLLLLLFLFVLGFLLMLLGFCLFVCLVVCFCCCFFVSVLLCSLFVVVFWFCIFVVVLFCFFYFPCSIITSYGQVLLLILTAVKVSDFSFRHVHKSVPFYTFTHLNNKNCIRMSHCLQLFSSWWNMPLLISMKH